MPGNLLLAELMYLTGYSERMGTGAQGRIQRSVRVSLPEPEFAVVDSFQTILHLALALGQEAKSESQPGPLEAIVQARVCKRASGLSGDSIVERDP